MSKLKTCTSKDTIMKMKRQPTDLEKIFANHIYDKGLLSTIYQKLLQLDKKTENSVLKWTKG